MKARKKPVTINVFQWTEESSKNMNTWPYWLVIAHNEGVFQQSIDEKIAIIKTLEGDHVCTLNDWIIQGVMDELYPCKPDIFEQTYDIVEE